MRNVPSYHLQAASRIGTALALNEIPAPYKGLKVLGRGATSIVLEESPSTVIMLTRDQIKSEWLSHNDYPNIGSYSSPAFRSNRLPYKDFPIEAYRMPKLFPLDRENKRKVRAIIKEFDSIRIKYTHTRSRSQAHQDMINECSKLVDDYELEFKREHALQVFINFISNYDHNTLRFDFGMRQFMQNSAGEVVLVDPVISSELIDVLQQDMRRRHDKIWNKRMESSDSIDGYKFFSDKAISFAKDQSASHKSRWTIIHMSPKDFLNMAGPGESIDKVKGIDNILQRGSAKFNDIPFLHFTNNGDGSATVVGHEGRHRVRALQNLSVKAIPVSFISLGGGKGPAIRWGSQDDKHNRIDVWPERLIGEGANASNTILFPNSIIYPHKPNIEASTNDIYSVQHAQDIIDKLCRQYGQPHAQVSIYDNPGMEALAYAGNNSIMLLQDHWNEKGLKKYEQEWQGLAIDSSIEGVLVHEFGHVLIKNLKEKFGTKRIWNISCYYAGIKNENQGMSNTIAPSAYGGENLSEFEAETFSAYHYKRAEAGVFSKGALSNAIAMWSNMLSKKPTLPKNIVASINARLLAAEIIAKSPRSKPITLYHGTSSKFLRSILKEGLKPGSKEGRWIKDDDANENNRSKASYGGVYFTANVMTARSSANNLISRQKDGDWNKLFICAQLQPGSVLPDEDNYIALSRSRISDAFKPEVLIAGRTHVNMGSQVSKMLSDEIDKILQKYVTHPDRKDIGRVRSLAREVILTEIEREYAWRQNKYPSSSRSPNSELKKVLERAHYHPDRAQRKWTWDDPLPKELRLPPPDIGEARARVALDKLIKATRSTAKRDITNPNERNWTNVRTLEPVGYSGSNKIVAVFEYIMAREKGADLIILHYGSIPSDFEEQWKSRIGAWPKIEKVGTSIEAAEPFLRSAIKWNGKVYKSNLASIKRRLQAADFSAQVTK